MRSMFRRNLQTSGKAFTVVRTSESAKGLLVNYNCRQHIDFPIELDIHSNEWIINSVGEKLFVTEIQEYSPYKSCYYLSEYEYNSQKPQSTTFNINADIIEHSIIGTQDNATISLSNDLEQIRKMINESSSSDKAELHELLSLLEQQTKTNEPIPKGFFYRFSSVMQRNSWISGAISSFLLKLLQIPIEQLLP